MMKETRRRVLRSAAQRLSYEVVELEPFRIWLGKLVLSRIGLGDRFQNTLMTNPETSNRVASLPSCALTHAGFLYWHMNPVCYRTMWRSCGADGSQETESGHLTNGTPIARKRR